MHVLRNASLFSGRKFTQPNSSSSGGEELREKSVRRLSLFIVYLSALFAFFSDVDILKKYYLGAMAL